MGGSYVAVQRYVHDLERWRGLDDRGQGQNDRKDEAGLYFAAYTKSLDVFDVMLSRMMGTTGDGLHDRLMEFSRAVTGATFFVPSLETLSSLKQ